MNANNSNKSIWEAYLPSQEIGAMWCAVMVLEALIITVFNILTITTFFINFHLRKRSSYCIVNLAVADLLVGAVSVPMNVRVLWIFFWGKFDSSALIFFYVQNTVNVFTGMASLFGLVLISLERMLATVYPLRHRTTSTLMYILAVSVTWVMSVIVAGVWICSFLFFELEVSMYLWMPTLLISLLVICTAYISVYIAVMHHNNNNENSILKRSFQKEKDLAMTLFIVAAVSLVSWVPFAVVQVINFQNTISLSFNVHYTAIVIANANSFINPVIYVFRMQSFRSALIRLITKCSKDRPLKKIGTNSRHSTVSELLLSQKRSARGSSLKTVTSVM